LTSLANSGWLLKRARSKWKPKEFPVRTCNGKIASAPYLLANKIPQEC
jgi:hypothetical protein